LPKHDDIAAGGGVAMCFIMLATFSWQLKNVTSTIVPIAASSTMWPQDCEMEPTEEMREVRSGLEKPEVRKGTDVRPSELPSSLGGGRVPRINCEAGRAQETTRLQSQRW
jgi:hypothetical protein